MYFNQYNINKYYSKFTTSSQTRWIYSIPVQLQTQLRLIIIVIALQTLERQRLQYFPLFLTVYDFQCVSRSHTDGHWCHTCHSVHCSAAASCPAQVLSCHSVPLFTATSVFLVSFLWWPIHCFQRYSHTGLEPLTPQCTALTQCYCYSGWPP